MKVSLFVSALLGVFVLATGVPGPTVAQEPDVNPAPDRGDQGEGPFERLIIRGATLIDGTGAPPVSPVDIVVEGDRIVDVRVVGAPRLPINEERRPGGATRELDATGMYVMPGFVDTHVHCGGVPKAADAEYFYKLWMAHGITTVRGVPCGSFEWGLSERERSANNEIVAPRLFLYNTPGSGWDQGPVHTPEQAREWVRWAKEAGIDGVKVFNRSPDVMEALMDEARQQNLGSMAHLAQTMVAGVNVIDAARMGLRIQTHFYGLFESLYKDADVQPWPVEMVYNDEYHRFGQVARQWNLIHEPGSDEWNALIEELVSLDFIIDPTFSIYSAGRDVMRARTAEWHENYTLPSLMEYYDPKRADHGSYFYDWTTWDEVAWKNFYRVWEEFVDDFKDAGGRVTVGSDAGFIYSTYGFANIVEMEMLQEAGFHPLEVIRGATMHAAESLLEPLGERVDFGVVRPTFRADFAIVDENPIQNLKVLYGNGTPRLNDETGEVERVGGVRYTIKDGIIYDAKELLADVARMVAEQKAERGTTE